MSEKTNPFDWVNNINNQKKTNIIEEADDPQRMEKEYGDCKFIVNRAFSYYADTIHFVNVLNKYHRIDKKLQYEFLLNAVRPMTRRAKWGKQIVPEHFALVKKYFKFSTAKTLTALSLLSDGEIAAIEAALDPGGMK